jgi:hypothetical protein
MNLKISKYMHVLTSKCMYLVDAMMRQMMQIIGYSISPPIRGGRCGREHYDRYPYGIRLATNKETRPFIAYQGIKLLKEKTHGNIVIIGDFTIISQALFQKKLLPL